jgi:hypothetical protein
MEPQRTTRTQQDLEQLMLDRGWELTSTISSDDSSTFSFANAGGGTNLTNTLSLVGRGATEEDRFADAVNDYLNEHPA